MINLQIIIDINELITVFIISIFTLINYFNFFLQIYLCSIDLHKPYYLFLVYLILIFFLESNDLRTHYHPYQHIFLLHVWDHSKIILNNMIYQAIYRFLFHCIRYLSKIHCTIIHYHILFYHFLTFYYYWNFLYTQIHYVFLRILCRASSLIQNILNTMNSLSIFKCHIQKGNLLSIIHCMYNILIN